MRDRQELNTLSTASPAETMPAASAALRRMTCIVCPIGCSLEVGESDGKIRVRGCRCAKGRQYGIDETVNPVRTITSTVLCLNAPRPLVPVRTSAPIPKARIMECMAEIRKARVTAPVRAGDVIIRGVLGLDVNIVATDDMESLPG